MTHEEMMQALLDGRTIHRTNTNSTIELKLIDGQIRDIVNGCKDGLPTDPAPWIVKPTPTPMTLAEMMQALLDGKTLLCTTYDTHELSLVNGMLRQVCINPLHGNRERTPNYEAFGRPELYEVKQ